MQQPDAVSEELARILIPDESVRYENPTCLPRPRCDEEAKQKKRELALSKPPRKSSDVAWWDEDYSDPHKIRDRELFA